MSYNIKFTLTAKNDLRDIAINITKESKEPRIALKFIEELQDSVKQLENFPYIGANPNDRILCSYGYKFLVHKEYLIFYTVEEDSKNVYIEAIFNSKLDYTRFLTNRI